MPRLLTLRIKVFFIQKKRAIILAGFTILIAVIGVLSIHKTALSDPECYMETEDGELVNLDAMCEPPDTLEERQRRSMEIFEEIYAASWTILEAEDFDGRGAEEIAQLAELDQRLQEAIALDPENTRALAQSEILKHWTGDLQGRIDLSRRIRDIHAQRGNEHAAENYDMYIQSLEYLRDHGEPPEAE